MQQWFHLVNLFYPNCCIACTKSLFKYEVDVCLKCWQKISFYKDKTGSVHFLCYYNKKGVVHDLIHSIKYKSNQDLAKRLGVYLGKRMLPENIEIDAILPVPMHPKKRILRGYNQAECIAKGISEILKKPLISEHVVLKTVFTQTQTKKDQFERWNTNQNVFVVQQPEKIRQKRILIVDDVYTTGATYTAVKQVLDEAHCRSVALAVLALTEKR